MNHRRRVLIIDDESELREVVQHILEERFDVLEAANGDEGIRMARQLQPDLVLLDVMMPKIDGFHVCQELRRNSETKHIPVLMVTGKDDPDSRIAAFASGADDYISKPFKSMELLARVESKIRRIEEKVEVSKEILKCGNLTLSLLKYEAVVSDRSVKLSVREFDLLKFFVDHKSRVVSRLEIMSNVWKEPPENPRLVDSHIVALRKKLVGFDHHIATIYSKGYTLKKGADPDPV